MDSNKLKPFDIGNSKHENLNKNTDKQPEAHVAQNANPLAQNQHLAPIVSVKLNIPGVGTVPGLVQKYPDGSIRVISINSDSSYVPSRDYATQNLAPTGNFLASPSQPIYPINRGVPVSSLHPHGTSDTRVGMSSKSNSGVDVNLGNLSLPQHAPASQSPYIFQASNSGSFGYGRDHMTSTGYGVPPLQVIDSHSDQYRGQTFSSGMFERFPAQSSANMFSRVVTERSQMNPRELPLGSSQSDTYFT
ncbi:hypothetical protein RF11_14034 [Thelohanellus kitauei]|uniref:Uncharacterized protein n=1 Tax=Thelohanellus kitauei TaxID=669202 RepID=A0A0C2MHP0_THEKT|nr:hypothetical protein RF11_14034 [Thelohanellus kitauei]